MVWLVIAPPLPHGMDADDLVIDLLVGRGQREPEHSAKIATISLLANWRRERAEILFRN